ncbi:hypothetical protein PJF56_16880 [Roseofilum sp. BLCC_M91]|uniref:Uncharacterized protein n=1 Tax=Roseofilum halophilum BLCC-M91 TaxID=3022259 RepID=A0ABT7BMW0_9CYAN|nr:hypothetical protein [Roseofilum halophilum]MDJ1180537.1 hypothetical protein [Roseofilum halophilum BLCC-M91]
MANPPTSGKYKPSTSQRLKRIAGIIFPILIWILIGSVWITLYLMFAIMGICFSALGIKFSAPKLPKMPKIPKGKKPGDFEDWMKQNADKSGADFLQEMPDFKPKNPKEAQIYEKLNSSNLTLEEIIERMSEEEYERFIEMLMRELGITFL